VPKFHKGFNLLRHLLPAIIWGVGIFIVISIPGISIPKTKLLNIENIDKIIHFILFFGFSLLMCMGFFKQNVVRLLREYYIAYAIALSIIYGGLTEVFQALWFDSRSGNIWDFFANAGGTISGALFFYVLFKKRLLKNHNIAEK